MGKVWPADVGRVQPGDDAAQQHRRARRIAAARRAALRRHRRRAGADHGGRRQELAQGRAVSRRAAVDLRVRRVRVAARRQHRVRRRSTTGSAATTSRTSSRAPTAAGRGRPSPATCRTAHDVWAIAQDHVNGNLLFAGTEFGVLVHASTAAALDAAEGRHAGDAGARSRPSSGARTTSWSAPSAAASSSSTTTRPLREMTPRRR